MEESKSKKGDKGLMIVSGFMILVGIISFFLDTTLGIIITVAGLGMFLMGYLSKSPGKKSK